MSLRLILIHFMYRIVFGVGIATLMWVGGNLVYAKTYQRYAMSKFKNDPDITGMSDADFSSHAPLRSRSLRVLEALDEKNETASGLRSVGKFADAGHRMAFVREVQSLRVGDTIQLSTRRGTFGYFVTTVEVIDPSESRTFEYPDHSELTIVTTPPFPFAGAVTQQFVVHARPQNEVNN